MEGVRDRLVAARAVALLLALVSGGCAGLWPRHQPAAQTPAEKPALAPPQTAPSDTAENAKPENDKAQTRAVVPSTEPPADDKSAPLPCTCAEAKPKPRPRTQHKHAHKEAPPQLLTAPVVAAAAPGSTVVAEVRSTPVSVISILGRRVKGPKDEDLGRVVDVLADASGRVRIAIIDFGGFLGVGNHRIAVDWPLLRFDPASAESPLVLSVSVEQLRTAPEYKDNPRPQTLMEPEAKAPPSMDSAPEPKK